MQHSRLNTASGRAQPPDHYETPVEQACAGFAYLCRLYRRQFLADNKIGRLPLERAGFGVAGPVLNSQRPCQLCVATLNAFVSILGAEAGSLALKVLASGGAYLGGGIPPRILPALEGERLMEAFRRKGPMSDLLARVPVHVILNPKIALLGAACHGLEL
jgi:hypothetical protein